ncbi:MAG TPA: HlyD family efflux transporter periplasmic adaptor subunit [Frateuria sp.]|uniref:HlyD family secretion protein n=1 Tax=Frateuria sp. TaxID=2211372 RepID=UPI002DE8FDEB|nr:HlyD family efflux transporter periplasmic adaptor subunit [Frateuria sp.]
MQQDSLLFRQEAIDAQQTRSLGTIRLATPVSHQMWTLAVVGIAAGTLVWLFAGHYTRREHVGGNLVPEAGLLALTTRSSGTVTAVAVTEGTVVHAGDPLLIVSDDRSSAALGDTSAVISAQLRQQQTRLQADLINARHLADAQADDLRMQQRMLADQIRQVDAQLAIEQRQMGDLSALLRRLQALGTKGYVSALDIQQQRTQELEAEGQMRSLARQRSESEQQLKSVGDQLIQLPLATAAKLNDLHNQLAQNQQSLAQSETDRANVVRAPVDGVVSSMLIQPGQTVAAGQSLLVVMPQGSLLQAQLLVPSSAIGFVHIDTPVVLHYQAFPYEKFGVQEGTVTSISRSALTPSEITTLLGQSPPPEALYRVQVRLASQTVKAYGKPTSLKPGMALDADLLLDRRRMIEWIFEPLYGMGHRLAGNG